MDDIKHHQVALDLQQGTIKAEPGEDIGQLIMERHPCAVIENEDDYSVLALSGPAVSGDGRELMFLGSSERISAAPRKLPTRVRRWQISSTRRFRWR